MEVEDSAASRGGSSGAGGFNVVRRVVGMVKGLGEGLWNAGMAITKAFWWDKEGGRRCEVDIS